MQKLLSSSHQSRMIPIACDVGSTTLSQEMKDFHGGTYTHKMWSCGCHSMVYRTDLIGNTASVLRIAVKFRMPSSPVRVPLIVAMQNR
jgi:hypothetical protein